MNKVKSQVNGFHPTFKTHTTIDGGGSTGAVTSDEVLLFPISRVLEPPNPITPDERRLVGRIAEKHEYQCPYATMLLA